MSAEASKVQKTASDFHFGAQTSTISDHQSTQREQADSILFQEASSIIYPLTWNEQQYEEFKRKNSWMYAFNGKIGCASCREVNNLGMRASRGVIISARWAEAMSLLVVAQERPSYHRFEKKSTSTKTLKHIKKLSIFLKQQRKMYCLT